MSFQISYDGLAKVRAHLEVGADALEETAGSLPSGPVDAGWMSEAVHAAMLELIDAAAQTSLALRSAAVVLVEHGADHSGTDGSVAAPLNRARAQ